MEKEFLKILTKLNKPIHYVLVGLCLVFWNYKFEKEPSYLLLLGIVLLLLSFASFIEFIVKKIQILLQKRKDDKKLKNKLDRVINEYEKLKGKEREIVEYCITKNSRVFQQPPLSFDIYTEAIESLIVKGLADPGSNAYNFIIDEDVFIILEQYMKLKTTTCKKLSGGNNEK